MALSWHFSDVVTTWCVCLSPAPHPSGEALPVGFLPGRVSLQGGSGSFSVILGLRNPSMKNFCCPVVQSPEPESPPSAASPIFTLNDWDVGKGHLSWVTHSVGMAQTSSPTDPRVKGWEGDPQRETISWSCSQREGIFRWPPDGSGAWFHVPCLSLHSAASTTRLPPSCNHVFLHFPVFD